MRSLELFAGAGGLGLGLHAAGFRPQAVIERDAYCCETIRENKPLGMRGVSSWPVVENDVREVSFGLFEDRLDLVSGGPPCQPFSLGGKHAAYGDARDTFPQAVRAVREIRPKAFVFENVRGLTRNRFRNYLEYIKLQLEHPEVKIRPRQDWTDHLTRLERHHTAASHDGGLRYNVVTRLLNAADYGVPQHRHRIFLVGFREDLGIRWAFPEPTHCEQALLWEQTTGEYWDRHLVSPCEQSLSRRDLKRTEKVLFKPAEKPWHTVRDALSGLPEPTPEGICAVANHDVKQSAFLMLLTVNQHCGHELQSVVRRVDRNRTVTEFRRVAVRTGRTSFNRRGDRSRSPGRPQSAINSRSTRIRAPVSDTMHHVDVKIAERVVSSPVFSDGRRPFGKIIPPGAHVCKSVDIQEVDRTRTSSGWRTGVLPDAASASGGHGMSGIRGEQSGQSPSIEDYP